MHTVVTTAEMREIDRLTTENYGIPSLQLMEQAAQTVTDEIVSRFGNGHRNVLILCGPGNNGGDGAAIARQLLSSDGRVTLVLARRLADTKGDARTNLELAARLSGELAGGALQFHECPDEPAWTRFLEEYSRSRPDFVVDALFGTGLTRPLTGVYESICNFINEFSSVPGGPRPLVVSVDIPSGLNSDSPFPIGPNVRADVTVTFTAPKLANVMPPASRDGGNLLITQIGSPLSLIEASAGKLYVTDETDAKDWLGSTKYLPGSFKNSHGHVLVIAGSRDYLGAPVLCGDAAMCSGAGLVTVATPASAIPAVTARLMPEIITAVLAETDGGAVSLEATHQVERLAKRADVLAAGPGLTSTDERTRQFMRWLVEHRRRPLVIDADGLNSLSPWPDDGRGSDALPLILTPHPGEMLRLLGTEDKRVLVEPWTAAGEFAKEYHLILVLKGEHTLIAAPDGRVFINPTGNPGVGTAGSGDTLTGVIAGFAAQEVACRRGEANLVDAVRVAVYVCGLAGDLAAAEWGMRSLVASDIRSHLSAAICQIAPDVEFP